MEVQNSDVCRLCLGSINPCDEIKLNNNQHLIKSIFLITGLEVVSDSEQCEYLCSQCLSSLEQCVVFRNTCIDNDGVFREMKISLNYVEDCKPEILEHLDMKLDLETNVENTGPDPIDTTEPMDDVDGAFENKPMVPDEEVQPCPKPPAKRKRIAKKKSNDGTDCPELKKRYRDSRKVQCPQCGSMVVHYNLKKHQEIHNPNRRKLRCPHCPKEYAYTSHLKLHISANHTHELEYTCDRCGKLYQNRNSLNEHYRAAHSDERRYACTVCGERFATASSRSYHQLKMHSTARPFACEYCDKTFKFKCDFVVHTRIHTGEKPYKCDICGKTFNKSYNVVIHKKSHQNSRKLSLGQSTS